MNFIKILENDLSLGVLTKVTPTKGKLVYEYNPFRNYRLSEDKFWYKDGYYTLNELDTKFGVKPNNDKKTWTGISDEEPVLYEKGLLVDFITDELTFSLEHPVHIVPQASYDGSVNLIINDGINVPRMINSRFSATGRNTYEVVDRKGNNDTNIYDSGDLFDIDTSLYKRVVKIPKLDFQGVSSGGNLKVGNYHFYLRLADADGNETDFVAESGLVSVFVGFGDPSSLHTGTSNENSYKNVLLFLSNIDSAYNYVYVYYSRSTALLSDNKITEYVKIDKKYVVSNADTCSIIITGFEPTIQVSAADINVQYNIVDAACTSAVCLNMLFLGNVHEPEIPYKELQDLSLHFLPYLKEERYELDIDHEYNISTKVMGYYDPKFIYNKTGYWDNEFYRLGVVYILHNGELSPVFNIRGAMNITTYSEDSKDGYSKKELYKDNERTYINYNEVNFQLLESTGKFPHENVKGVVKFNANKDADTIYGIEVRMSNEAIKELKKYVKGYFFVRLERIPTILAQGITIGIDLESNTPCLPTADGVIQELKNSLDYTHVETKDINDVNYISEGFLNRYLFEFKNKKSGLFSKVLKGVAIGIAVVAACALVVVTAGAAAPVLGAAATTIVGGITTAATSAVITTAAAVGVGGSIALTTATTALVAGAVAGAGVAIAGGVLEARYAIKRAGNVKRLNGRDTKAPGGMKIVEVEQSRKLSHNFMDRIIIKDPTNVKVLGILCPDYELNLPLYNQIFTGNKHKIELTKSQSSNALSGYSSNYFNNYMRHFYILSYYDAKNPISYNFKIIGVPDNTKLVGLDDLKFRSRAGDAEEVFKFENVSQNFDNKNDLKKINSDIIRGCFGPYLAFNDEDNKFSPAETVNIYIPDYSEANLSAYVSIRMEDKSAYKAISDRIDINEISTDILGNATNYSITLYRGDCYLCLVTHRLNRNFNDPSSPYNDTIVDADSWKDNYDPEDVEKLSNINLGDLNAVLLGMWVTFKIRSSNNLNIRTLNGSYVNESAMTGHERGYYPYHLMSAEGTYKHPESDLYNNGFKVSLSDKWNIELPDVPYIKNWFGTRIMYSDIHTNDAFKNGFRVFQKNHYRDYTREYGEIVKLISLESSLLCVFEHGIALIPVNERAIAGEGLGGNVFINTSNVLPENPRIISDMFGSLWPESILKVPGKTGDAPQYIYGVDTVARKIWRTDGVNFQCISDFKVQEFLNNNITLGERELTPKIGIRNVKTHYNAFKRDVMFTFYDNTYGFEERVWNLCWNELLQLFVTFYSWLPSYMENINNIPFSFNRDTSKWVAKLGVSHTDNSFADGITLSNVIIDGVFDNKYNYSYIDEKGIEKKCSEEFNVGNNFIGYLSLSNRTLPAEQVHYTINYSLERDNYQNYKMFEILSVGNIILPKDAMFAGKSVPVYGLFFASGYNKLNLFSELYYRNKAGNVYPDDIENKTSYLEIGIDEAIKLPIFKNKGGKRLTLPRDKALNPDKIVTLLNIKANITLEYGGQMTDLNTAFRNLEAGFNVDTSLVNAGYYESTVAIMPKENMLFLSTDFWKHGQAGIIDITDAIYPTYWYGKLHPFEFECIVVNDPSVHKIFTNLELVANKAKPESFHYEVIGDTYDFAKDKVNMYFRQEARKAIWQYNGSDICYNKNFLNIQPKQVAKSADLIQKYFNRIDTINDVEDYYLSCTYPYGNKYDYRHLSGAEIVYYPNQQEYRIWSHAQAICLDSLSLDTSRSLIASNCRYLEDKWKILINPILICYKNEYKSKILTADNSLWTELTKPRIPVNNSPIPELVYENIKEANGEVVIPEVLTNLGYSSEDIDTTSWLNLLDVSLFGNNNSRQELGVRGKFLKVRIRYSGEELAIIDFLNTIYDISYA